jgi:hypothetical protein
MDNDLKTRNLFMKLRAPLLSTVATIGIVSVCCQSARAQPIFEEGFNYTSGSALASKVNPYNGNTWTGGNDSELQIGSSQLTYSGLSLLTGNELLYTSSGSSSTSYNTYTAVTSGSIYYSFLIDCTSLPTASEYIMALNPGTTTPGGSTDAMSTYVNSSGTGWKIGARAVGANTVSTGTLALNTTYFVVEELTLNSGGFAVANLYLDPVPGNAQPGTPTATDTGTGPVASVADIGFKVQSTTATGDFDIGNLLIATDWADVTPAAAVPEPNTLAFLGGGMVLLQVGWRRLQKRG